MTQVMRSFYVCLAVLLTAQPALGRRPALLPPPSRIRPNGIRLCAAAVPLSESRSGEQVVYHVDPTSDSLVPEGHSKKARRFFISAPGKNVAQRLRRVLSTMFLPAGYPQSVAPEYLKFQAWNVVQDLSTYLRGILATQAILEGVGVGKAGATPLAATLQWITRDGASMMSGLVFTSLVSTNFGTNVKVWRLFADVIVDVGITLEMLAPLFPRHFLLCICLASVCKALCGIAAGSSNGAIVEHWARQSNIADVLAKGGAQHTAVSLAGLGFGMWFAKVANANPLRVWTAYIILTLVHLGSNYAAMKVLALRSINRSRLDVLLQDYLALPTGADKAGMSDKRFSPAGVGPREVVLPWLVALSPLNLFRRKHKIRMGVRLRDLTSGKASDLSAVSAVFKDEKYVISTSGSTVLVALRQDASGLDQIKAYLHAKLLCNRKGRSDGDKRVEALKETLREAQAHYVPFEALLKAQNWDLSRVLLESEGWAFDSST